MNIMMKTKITNVAATKSALRAALFKLNNYIIAGLLTMTSSMICTMNWAFMKTRIIMRLIVSYGKI